MTTETLYNALETSLQALEQSADAETCLARFPDLADELRPILETAAQARSAAVTKVPEAAMRRGKARFLQAAAEIREQAHAQGRPANPARWQLGRIFRLTLASLAMVVFLLTSGTGLVRAASGTVPGDNLYPVKRSWEGVRLLLTFDQQAKVELESEYEQERVQEIATLFIEKRTEQVHFRGVVATQQSGVWKIANLEIAIDNETKFNAGIIPGALVEVIGKTDNGVIKAEQINLLATPSATFTPRPSATHLPPTARPTETETKKPRATKTLEATETSEPTPTFTETVEPTETEKVTVEPKKDKTPKPDDNSNDDDSSDDHGGGDDNSGKDK